MKKGLIIMSVLFSLLLTACSDEETTEYEEQEDMQQESEEPTPDANAVEYDIHLYSDDYLDITLASIQADNVNFVITNNSDENISVMCDYVTLDDKTYHYEDTNYSTPDMEFAPGETRDYMFCDWDMGNETDFSVESTECTTLSARFGYYTDSSEGVITYIETGAVDLN